MKIIGIYKIKNIVNNKIYIGSSSNINKRKTAHFSYLKRNNHPNKHLQNSYNKHGKNNFEFNILEICTIDDIIQKEQYYIDKFLPHYNKRIIAESNFGWRPSEEYIKKFSIKMTGEGNYFYGLKHSDESKLKMRLAKLGKPSKKSLFPGKSISKYSLNMQFIENYKTLKECATKNNLPYKWFIETINNNPEYKGYIWIKENK